MGTTKTLSAKRVVWRWLTKTTKQTSNLSFWAKGGVHADRSRTFTEWRTRWKREAFCRSGIWLKIPVACQRKCYIYYDKSPKLQAISLRRVRSLVLLVRFAQPAKLRLRKPLRAFLRSEWHIDCLFCIFSLKTTGRRWRRPLRTIIKFIVARKKGQIQNLSLFLFRYVLLFRLL